MVLGNNAVKISIFSDLYRRLVTIISFVLIGSFFSSVSFSNPRNIFKLPDNSGNIFWKCGDDQCNIYLQKKNSDSILLLRKTPSPSVSALNKNLVKLFFSCGSPCNYTIFYNSKNKISLSFEFVIAVDAKRELVVVAEKNQLVAYKIFDSAKTPIFRVKRDWSPSAALFSDIIEAKFVDNAFYIKYVEGVNFKEKVEKIDNL